MAKVPGTNVPITISTIHPGLNGQYYVGNPVGHQLNGFTVPIYIKFGVVCGSTYHFKFAVADCVDGILDTGVFLESGSFSSTSVDVNVAPDVAGDTLVYEGCSAANISFIRPASQANTTLSVNYTLSGTAIMGADFNPIPNPVVFPIGVDTVSFSITPIADGIPDNNEYVTITAYTISACGDTIISSGTLYLSDSIPINIIETDKLVKCINDSVLVSATAIGAFGPYTFAWQGGQIGDTAYFPTVQNATTGVTNFLVTATNSCGYSETDTVTITLNQTLAVDTMGTENSNYCANTGIVWGLATGTTGQPFYNWTGPNPSSAYTIDASVLQNVPSGWYTFTIADNVCEVYDSIFVDTDPGPVADFTTSTSSGCAPLSVNFFNESTNAVSYTWNFGNGNVVTVTDLNTLNQIFTDTSIITLIASDGICNDTISGLVLIENCGCTDPMATNYNPLATSSDGSCVYPTPIIEGPNVITPDGDNVNDVFELDIINAEKVELVITNRWGNVMFKGTSLNPTWDGKVNGNVVSDGVYFYKYTAYSIQGDEIVGHGFFHVVNK
jgi:gliding motility-associated-like protein